ncbi:hypothetical protein WN944_006648 [Citrus x changshan-huyou]|uniref:Uncharacterized protein n=1 Tax=Citrus x changshan-huyou TaxID=2935761 RepID=A0AAP0QXD1_9ROSI
MEAALKEMPKKVTFEMNEELMRPFTEEEIKEALFQMCPTKAPEPDGFPATFFQKHWKAVREGVVAICLHILNEKGNLTPLNYTYIAFIPKIEKPRDSSFGWHRLSAIVAFGGRLQLASSTYVLGCERGRLWPWVGTAPVGSGLLTGHCCMADCAVVPSLLSAANLSKAKEGLKARLRVVEEQLKQIKSRRKNDLKANTRVAEIFTSHMNVW